MSPLDAKFLRGSYPPIVTPFQNGAVDYSTYEKLVDFQIENGSHGIVVTGTTGEPSSLTTDERAELLRLAVDVAAKRVPIVAATGSQSYAETLELTKRAAAAGADALLIVTPYYSKPPQRGLVAYYTALGQAIDLPFMVYHIPGRTAIHVTIETLEAIADACPHFVGMKHAVNDLAFVTQAIERLGPEFRIFAGLEELSYPILAIGGAGVMNAVSNVAPRKVADLYETTVAGDMDGARALHQQLNELNLSVFYDTNPIAMKYMMKRMGILPTNEHRLPMMPATPELEKRLDGVLERAGLLRQSVEV